MNLTLRHLQPIATIKVIFAIVLTLLSLYLFFEGTMFGIILLGAALKLALREGVEVDLEGKRYRKIYSVFDINVGLWKTLPVIEYISVFKTKKKSRSRVISAEATLESIVYKLNLFYSKNKHIEAYISDNKEDAFKVANHIASVLEVEVYNAAKE